jgi:signal transduction histidine kinase
MSSLRVPFHLTLAGSALALVLLTAAATVAGYFVEAHGQQADRDHRLAAAEAYASRTAASLRPGLAPADAQRFQQALPKKLAGLGVGTQLTLISPTGKRLLYANSAATAQQPAASYTFPLDGESGTALTLDLYPPPSDRGPPLLAALGLGLGALLVGTTLLIWAASRWLVAPLRRLNVQVDAIAGGDRIETHTSSPIQEVHNVAAAVEGMAARLTQTAEQDARAEVERRLLVSSIAHDLRTPLFALRGYLDAIAAGIGNPAERLDGARAKADQIDRLVTRLFEYARAEIEQRPPLQATDLAAAVSDAAAAFEFAARERGVQLRVSIDAAPAVAIDPDGFERALANVIDNALQHTPRGGTVDVGCGADAEGAFVRVVDDGPGIAPDLLPRIFEPMVRADRARNSRSGGSGLGLTIAARLLRNQGGTIHAGNASKRGAIVTLRVPRTSA